MARILDAFLESAPARLTELDTLAATNTANAANTIKQLQDLGVGGDPIVDTRAALAKLTGNQTLTDAEKRALGLSVAPVTPVTTVDTTVKTDGRPDINNRNITPPDPGEGYRWQWVSMAYANNKWGGEWRKVAIDKGTGGGGTGGSTDGTGGTKTLVSTETDEYGNVIGFYSDGSKATLVASGNKYKSTVDVDAYALLEQTFKDFGLDDPEILKAIQGFMEQGIGSNQAAIELRKTTAYINRFRGNEIRRQAGLNVVSEAEYLQLENSYNETLRAYGLQGYFGVDRKVSQSKMADIIGNDISATEFKDRIDTVVTRVNNSEPTIKNTLKSFYGITDTDLVGYFLNPKENLPKLQEKVTAAEIGSEALKQGLLTGVESATALAQAGITKAKAAEGYQTIGQVLPTATKLGQIYGEEGINYSQTLAEQEIFNNLESARRKRVQLAEKEIGTFSGASGLSRGALGGTTSSF